MIFSSLVFLLLFLPVSLAGYYLVGKKFKNYFLLLSSLFFYSWGGFDTLPIFIASIIGNYFFALVIEKNIERKGFSKFLVVIMLVANISLLLAFKYLAYTLSILNHLPKIQIEIPHWALPLGISFFTFSAISYVLDVYFQVTKAEKNILNVALYISFFPKLISGPLMQWASFQPQLADRKFDMEKFSDGISRFIVGLAKKVIIADSIAQMADFVFDSSSFGSVSVVIAWFSILTYCIQLYFDFSGYSDMAIGLGKMFGFEIDENFNYPYISTTVTEFWGKRWHVSLGTWINHYIYTPVFRALSKKNPITGKKRSSKTCDYIALLVTWCIIGPWHDAGLSYLVYGLYFFVFIFFERLYDSYKKKRKKLGNPIKGNYFTSKILPHIYFVFVLFFGFLLFRANSLKFALQHACICLGLTNNSFFNEMDMFYLSHYWILALIGIIFSLPVVPFAKKKLLCLISPTVYMIIEKIILLSLFVVSFAFTVGSTYKSFIYFKF